MQYFIKKFDSLYEYENYLSRGKTQRGFEEESSFNNNLSFTGTASYEEANMLLMHGDHKMSSCIRERIPEEMYGVHSTMQACGTQTHMQRGAVGYRVNIGAFLSGSKKCMLRKVRQRIQQPVITLCYNNGIRSGISTEEAIEVNSRVMAAVMEIEAVGIRVNLYVSQLSKENDGAYVAGPIIRIKDADQLLDSEKMGYPLCNPSILRRHKFRFLEIHPNVPRAFAGTYGSSLDSVAEYKMALDEAGVKHDVCFTFYNIRKLPVGDLVKMFKQEN